MRSRLPYMMSCLKSEPLDGVHAHPRPPWRELLPVTDDLEDFSNCSISDCGAGVGGFLETRIHHLQTIKSTTKILTNTIKV